jgi:putative ABC transport system permease protein
VSDLGLILSGLGRKPLRTGLLVFAVFIAFLIYAVLAAFQASLSSAAGPSSSNRLVVANRINFTQPLPLAYVNRIAAIDGVEDVSYSNWFGGYYQEPRNFLLTFAVDPESYTRIYSEYVMPEDQRRAFIDNRDSIMVGRALADQYGWTLGQQIPLSSSVWRRSSGGSTWPVVIRAIYDGKDAQTSTGSVFMHFAYLDESRTFGKDTVGIIQVVTPAADQNDAVAARIDQQFVNSRAETETLTEAAFNAAFIDQQGNIGLIILGVTGAAFVTILLIVGNAMTGAIRERSGEIAVMKTIGFTSARIGRIVIGETMALSLIGGLLGVFLAGIIAGALAQAPGFSQFLGGLAVTPGIALTALLLIVLLGFITGAIPAFNAMRVNVVTAFRRL